MATKVVNILKTPATALVALLTAHAANAQNAPLVQGTNTQAQANEQTQTQRTDVNVTNANNGGSAAAASASSARIQNRALTGGAYVGVQITPDNIIAKQQFTGKTICYRGKLKFATQGDAFASKNSAEAVGLKIELDPAEKKARDAEIKAARKAGNKDLVKALKTTPYAACDELMEDTPNFTQPAQPVTMNVTMTVVTDKAETRPPVMARPPVTARRRIVHSAPPKPHKPVVRRAAPTCACAPKVK